MRIGVMASQGAFAEHIAVLRRLKVDAEAIRLPGELKGLDGLIIPGGESTTISRLMREYDLLAAVRAMATEGLPVFGTCAGLVMLATDGVNGRVEPLGLMDIRVRRNAFGRQRESFEQALNVPALGSEPFRGIFIRAPAIEEVHDGVEVLARLEDGTIVAARQGKLIATAFHPELAGDARFHRYFLDVC
jgi:pyridoxal 5'-phosphate synthase pdxT subunit